MKATFESFLENFDWCKQTSEFNWSTVESRISGTQNSGKSRISGQSLNDQLIIDRIEWTTKIVEISQ